MRKLLLFFALLMCSVGTWAYSVSRDYGDGKTVNFSDGTTGVQQLTVGAGGLAEWFNDATANQSYLSSTSRTKLVITGTLNADDIAAIKTYFTPFTTVDMEGVTLEEGASVKGMQLPNAEYMALPHGTPIADMKTLKSGCPKLKAVAATNADSPTEFTGYSWAAGEIWNICQSGLVDGIASGVCANTMEKLTIGGTVDDSDVSTSAATSSDPNKNWSFAQGASAQYYVNEVGKTVAQDEYLKPTHNEQACSPWTGATEISLDFTEAIFSNFGDLAVVSLNVTELLLPTDPNFTKINKYMFADRPKLKHIIIPNNIVTVGDAAYYVAGNTSVLEEISIGNGVKTIGNAAFAATGRSLLEDVRFSAGISDVKILSNVFGGCTGIKHMTLPEGVVSIGEKCFYQLVSLESVHFPTTLQYIGINCFAQTGLTSLTIPKSVKVIDYHAFDLCRITDIYLMAETVEQLPYIYATKWDYSNAGTSSTFDSSSLNGNNTTPQISTKDRDTEEIASKDSYDAEEFYRLSVKDGNTIARLHYNAGVESFINLNPWYVPGQTTPKPKSNALVGTPLDNGGIYEAEGLSDTYYFKDSENNTYPAQNGNDLARASYAAYFSSSSNSKAYDYTGGNADYSLEDGSSLQTQYYDPVTGNLIPFTEVTTHMWKVLRKEGWRQFTFRAGDAGSEDVVFNKSYENIWYTMCFPFSLTDEQLETAFNAEYNIADFSGVEVNKENENGNREIILHFNTIAKAKYFDLQHNEYQRVEGSKQIKQMGQSKFNIYTYTRDNDEYKYVETYSNKSYAKNGDKSNGIVYIDGYLAQAGHPYMIHPNLGTQQGDLPVVAHMVGINYYSKDPQVIDQLCKDRARSIDLGTGKGYEGVTYSLEDASDIAVKTENELEENFQQAAYSNYPGQTYSFVGNCNEYTADAPAYPSLDNENAAYRLEALPNIEDFVDAKYLPNGPVKAEKGDAPSEQEVIDRVGARMTEEDAPTPVEDPNYGEAFVTFYNKELNYYSQTDGKWVTYTWGDALINHYSDLFASYVLNNNWNGNIKSDNEDLCTFLDVTKGDNNGFDPSLLSSLVNKCNVYKSYVDYGELKAVYDANVEAWAAYDAAYEAWDSFSEEQAQADYEEAFAEYGAQLGRYNGEVNRVNEANNGKINTWRNDVKAYAVYIPENAYFLSRNSGEYYTHFFREKASLATRKTKGTGKWTRYSAVLIPNAAALAGVETLQSSAASKAFNMVFDESFTAVEPTAIEQIVEEAKQKGQSVQYMDVVVSVNGQVVRRGDTSLEGLPSGIYIINGKKYFVK